MNLRRTSTAIFLIGVCFAPFVAVADALSLSTSGTDEPLGPWLEYLVEGSHPHDLGSVTGETFQSYEAEVFNLGLEPAPIWLRLPVANVESGSREWVLAFNRALLEELDVFLVVGGSSLKLMGLTEYPVKELYEEFGTLATRFSLPGNETGTLYIRFRAPNSSTLPLTILSDERFDETRSLRMTIYLASFAGVATLVLYNLIMFFLTGLRLFPYYVLSQVLAFAYFSHLGGITSVFLWPDSPEIGRGLSAPLTNGVCIFMCLFARGFLATRESAPRADRVLVFLIGGLTLVTVIAVLQLAFGLEKRTLINVASSTLASITWLVLPFLGLKYSLSGELRFVPVAVAWWMFAFIAIYTTLTLSGWVPVVPDFLVAFSLFNFVEALLLAVSLALWVRDLRDRSLATETELGHQLKLKLEESERSRRLAEERNLAIQELAEQGRLLQAAGHDSRQVLGAMRHFATGLRHTTDDERVDVASQSILRLTSHLDDVLSTTVGTYQGGGLNTNIVALERIHVADLFEPMRMIYERTALANDVALTFRSVDFSLVTDRVLLLRVISNLVGNAVKYAAGGKVLVAGRIQQGHPVIEIWDNGPGMDPALLAALLEDDASARRDSELPGSGTGIGIAKRLAEAFGGEVEGTTWPDRGTRFRIHLPDAVPGASLDATDKPVWPCSIAVFDEAQSSINGLVQELAEIDSEIDVRCYTSVEAWEQEADDRDPDVVLVDQHFAGNGGEFAESFVSKGVAAALMTHDKGADVRNTAAKSVSVMLYKPVMVDVLQFYFARVGALRADNGRQPVSLEMARE